MRLKSLVPTLAGLLLLFMQPLAMPAQAAPQKDIPDELMRAIEQVSLATLSFGEAVRANIDRSAFNQESLIDKLDFDDAEIAQFVTERIAYEPYAGVLRGAHGTLLARAGNAVDQSLLLATLLNDAGFEAVIRGGTLSHEDAQRLITVLIDRPAPTAAWDASAVVDAQTDLLDSYQALNEANAKTGRVPRFTMEHVVQAIERDRDDLLAALKKAGIRLGTDDAAGKIVAEAREYFWVDYRLGPSTPWMSVHPAFGKAAAPVVTVASTYAGNVPSELTHRVRIELIVERKFGDKIETAALMAPMEFPSANVAGRSVSLMLVPDTLLRKDPFADGASPLEETRFLIPMFNNGLPDGARALALNGMTVPPDVISVSAAGIFETVGNRFLSAASALRGMGSSEEQAEDLAAIQSLRLMVTVIHPKSGPRTIERVLYRAPGEAAPGAGADEIESRMALVSELARAHSLGFITGSLAPAYVADQSLAALESLAPMIRAWADPAMDGCESLACLPQPDLDKSPSDANIALVAARFDNEMPAEPGSVVYRDSPNVLHVSQPLFPESSPVPGVFDIMNNSRRAFRIKDGAPVPAADLVLLAGVAETHLERMQWNIVSPATTIDRQPRNQASLNFRAWRNSTPTFSGSVITETEMITKAISEGSVVVTAEQTDDNAERLLGWWEIEPYTGLTLGMAKHGGVAITEYLKGFGAAAAIAGGSTAGISGSLCALLPQQRISPAANSSARPRRQKATWLSCTFCAARTVLAPLFRNIHDEEGLQDEVAYCIGEMGGWEDE